MIEVRQTAEFSGWLHRLKDANAVARIVARIRRMELGNSGDAKSIGKGVVECGSIMDRAIASIMCAEAWKS
jgi:putative addiction module killer protein